MVKKKDNKLRIDYENCIIEGRLQQVKSQAFLNNLELIKVWTIDINPKDSPKVLSITRELALKDPVSLLHIKRIQPVQNVLRIVLCSESLISYDALISQLDDNLLRYENTFLRDVPSHCPGTKELAIEWSKSFWPIVWKGNPNDQILNDVKVDILQVKQHLQSIAQLSNNSTKVDQPIVSSIVDPYTNQVIALVNDQRHIHPLDHSIMNCIQTVSIKEQRKREDNPHLESHYLCYGYHVYTTHEPCSMCAMALIHSRISRLIYLKRSPLTGALHPSSGEGYNIHSQKLLNSSFEVWEWIGDEYDVPEINKNLNA